MTKKNKTMTEKKANRVISETMSGVGNHSKEEVLDAIKFLCIKNELIYHAVVGSYFSFVGAVQKGCLDEWVERMRAITIEIQSRGESLH